MPLYMGLMWTVPLNLVIWAGLVFWEFLDEGSCLRVPCFVFSKGPPSLSAAKLLLPRSTPCRLVRGPVATIQRRSWRFGASWHWHKAGLGLSGVFSLGDGTGTRPTLGPGSPSTAPPHSDRLAWR